MRRGLQKVRKVRKFLREALASHVNEARSRAPWVIEFAIYASKNFARDKIVRPHGRPSM